MARTLNYSTTLTNMVTAILSLLDDQTVKEFIDAGFDRIEDLVKASDNKIDDAVVLPMMAKIRQIIGVPDNDEPVGQEEPSTPTSPPDEPQEVPDVTTSPPVA